MTASGDPTPRPAWALTMWTDDHNIYVELPMSAAGVPYIMTFALTEGGLGTALEILKKRRKEVILPTAAEPANYTLPKNQPQVKLSKQQEKLHAETTAEQRENARALLSKLGLKR
jgi:hypothetical protein